MKITTLTYGSRGDLQSLLALSFSLMEAGHSVKLAAPDDWLLPRCKLVNHGGAGTMAAGSHAGIPKIVIPFLGDHPF